MKLTSKDIKPCAKIEYELLNCEHFWQAAKEYTDGELFNRNAESIGNLESLLHLYRRGGVYRKV